MYRYIYIYVQYAIYIQQYTSYIVHFYGYTGHLTVYIDDRSQQYAITVRLGNRHRALDFERRLSAAISSAILEITGKSGFDNV